MTSLLQSEINAKLTICQILIVLFWLLFLLYIGWEYYWFTKVSWGFVKWHTHFLPHIMVLFAALTFVSIKKVNPNFLLLVFSITFSLLTVEALLLLTRNEKENEYFVNHFREYDLSYYHTWYSKQTHVLSRDNEFSFERNTNSLGFSDVEWKLTNADSTIRVLTLGDSFTEGDGAPADSAYPSILQDLLGSRFEVLNAGTCGSDPVYNYKNLVDRLLPYSPNYVVQTISSHDLFNDIVLRGGFERYAADNSLHIKPSPFWVYPSMVSQLARIIFRVLGYDLSSPVRHTEKLNNEFNSFLQELYTKYAAVSRQQSFTTLFVILPMKHEVERGQYDFDFQLITHQLKDENIVVLDLLPCYLANINAAKSNYSAYYWVVDAHHNSRGYKMMAECIANQLKITTAIEP